MVKPKVIIHWCCFVPQAQEFVRGSLNSLASNFNGLKGDPAEKPLPNLKFRECTVSDSDFVYDNPKEVRHKAEGKPLLFVFCDQNHRLKQEMQLPQRNPEAKWGAATLGQLAVVWMQIDEFVIWHEVMHLLYADDCYHPGSKCEEESCLMQQSPTSANCRGRLVLCNVNLQRIRNNHS